MPVYTRVSRFPSRLSTNEFIVQLLRCSSYCVCYYVWLKFSLFKDLAYDFIPAIHEVNKRSSVCKISGLSRGVFESTVLVYHAAYIDSLLLNGIYIYIYTGSLLLNDIYTGSLLLNDICILVAYYLMAYTLLAYYLMTYILVAYYLMTYVYW